MPDEKVIPKWVASIIIGALFSVIVYTAQKFESEITDLEKSREEIRVILAELKVEVKTIKRRMNQTYEIHLKQSYKEQLLKADRYDRNLKFYD